MSESNDQERTEKPTPRKMQKARERGESVQSQEITSTVVLFSGLFLLMGLRFGILGEWQNLLQATASSIPNLVINEQDMVHVSSSLIWRLVKMVGPVFLVVVIGAVATNVLQKGFTLTAEPLMPQFSRLNLLSGLSTLFSKKTLSEMFKGSLKLLGIGFIAYFHIGKVVDQRFLLINMDTGPLFELICQDIVGFAVHVALFMVALSGFDYFIQRKQWLKKMMMTKQEIKEEMKESEGNPQMKSKIKSLMRKLSGNRMMSRIQEAKVVITNPTHFAVALEYNGDMRAPKVLAKGAGFLAQKIKEKAYLHNVPVVENKPLARLLYRWVEIGDEIPSSLYQAVAEVLAYIHRIGSSLRSVGHGR